MADVDVAEEVDHPNVEDTRIILRIQSNSFIPSHSLASSNITTIWKSQFTGEWDTWTSVPQKEKDVWFDVFKDKYKWDARLNVKVRKLFNTVGSKSFRNYMCKARRTPANKPEFMNLTAWQTLCRRWHFPEFISKSKRLKVARQANKRLHVGGSISNVQHKRRLEKELGREPMAGEVFMKTHQGKDGTFVDNQAQETWEQYMKKYGEEDLLDADVANTYSRWAEHVGVKNGKAYGSVLDEYILHNVNMEEASVQNDHKEELVELREMGEEQKLEHGILRAEMDNIRYTQQVQSRKLDQVFESQTSLVRNLRTIVSQEVHKSVAQEVSKAVAYEMGKATRQLLETLQGRV